MRDLPLDELHRIWNGEYRDWEKFGDPAVSEIKRVSVAGDTGPMPGSNADLGVPSLDVLAEFVRFNRGTIAFVPRDKIDYRFRTLRIDGRNILAERVDSDFEDYPLIVEQEIAAEDVPDAADDTRPVSLTVLGDIIYGRTVHQRLAALGDFTASFKAIHQHTSKADITLGDLECSLSDSIPQPEVENPQTFLFKSVTDNTEALKLGGVDVLSRANNHSFNFGVQGMDDTTRALDEAGILHFGMGHNLEEARQATVVEIGGHSYAFLGYNGISDQWDGATPGSAGTAPMLDWLVIEDIQRERERGHIVIPYFHWGIEYVDAPTEQQRYFAHISIDSGAAMVLGSHPHWVQATEIYKARPIIYSLGNFIFDQSWSVETTQGMYADIWLDADHILEIDLVPILIELDHRPRRLDSWQGEPIMERVWAATDRIPPAG
ncbi:MAG: CapA family protein [Chloroflexota bacterium]